VTRSTSRTLGRAFRGLERHLTDRIIDEAGEGLVGTKTDGTRTIARDDLGPLKQRVLAILQHGLTVTDLQHSGPFVMNDGTDYVVNPQCYIL